MSAPRYLTAPGQLDLAPCGTAAEFGFRWLAVKNWEGIWKTNMPAHEDRDLTSEEMFEIAGSARVKFVVKKEELDGDA